MQKFFLKVLSRLKLLRYLNLLANTNGVNIPIIGGIGYINYYGTEIWMTQLLQKLLGQTKDCFVDVGVNLGQTLIKVRGLNKDIEYIGFEPNPVCIFYAEKLILANQFKNCKIIPAGVSNKTEILTLRIFADESDPMASIIEDFKDQAKNEKSVIVIGEDLLGEFADKKIGILKIDVEGAELYVLEGFLNLIRRDRPYILMEILPAYTETIEYSGRLQRQEQVMAHLKNIQYSMLRILKSEDDLAGLSPIADIGKHTDYHMSDYLFVPTEKLEQIIK
jgi:FkbM family methyltransferase